MRSHLPVVVTQGATEVRAGGMEYDNLARVVDLKGHAGASTARATGALRRRCSARSGPAIGTAPLVFITGASSGIGQALAARFHRAGYRLALVARRAAEVEAWARGAGFRRRRACAVYAADVRDVAAITAAGRACIAAQGVPDVVIANAGISVGIDTAESSPTSR